MLKFQIHKGLKSGHAFEPYFIGKRGMAITLTAFSDRFRNLRGAQRASGVLRLRRFRFGKRRQLREEIFRADAVTPTKKQSKMIRAPDTPRGAAAFHAIADERIPCFRDGHDE